MKQKVQLLSFNGDADETVGEIYLEDGHVTSNRTQIALNVLRAPVWLDNDTVKLADDPVRWFNGLAAHYKSYALRATKPARA